MNVKVLLETSVKTLNKVYEYFVPCNMEKDIQVGKRVKVNFGIGVGMQKEGVIVSINPEGTSRIEVTKSKGVNIIELKPIVEILDSVSYIDIQKMQLAKWIARSYFCNVYDAFKLMLPTMGNEKLLPKDIIGKQAFAVSLALPGVEIEEMISQNAIKSIKHVKLLKYLLTTDFIYLDDIIANLEISKAVINTMKKNGYICVYKQDVPYDDYTKIKRTAPLVPTDEQKPIIESLHKKIIAGKYSTNLLRGVTGSGKTEVYLQAIAKCIEIGKTAIVLVPEIALTYQTKTRFVARFGMRVSVMHSKMTMLQKQTEYRRIKNGEVDIVIGARSALFVPLENIGLIVIDEEHDSSYISQTTPKYSAKAVASYIAYQNNAVLLLGSATPEISTMYKALSGQIGFYQMLKRPR